MTVSAEQRAALARAVSGLRRIFEAEYAALAEGKFGIHLAGRRAGEIEDATALSLSAHDLTARNELVGVVEYLRGEGVGAREAVERMVREAVFTTVNRLLAIRVAEAVGVLPPSLLKGNRSEGFAEAVEAFPLLRDADDSGGYWTYVQICGDELSHAVPRLFDRRHPLSALAPSADALDAAVEVVTDPALTDVWVEPEALGWSYQFFNSQDERVEAKTRNDTWALAVRTQFFTPRFVVDFLVQNTLGRRLRESGFSLDLPLLLGEPDESVSRVSLTDIAVLDPAVGSGHFLLGAYDLLEEAWAEQGVPPSEAAPLILQALNGIDIDPRAAQVAQAVLFLRARRSSPDVALGPPPIVAARSLPRNPDVRAQIVSDLPPVVAEVLDGLESILQHAPSLGTLLKPEQYVRAAIKERFSQPQLGDPTMSSFEEIEAQVLEAVALVSGVATSSPAERLFAADSRDALRFTELCQRRYDVVVMNPPFGECLSAASSWLKDTYGSYATELYAAFAERGLELVAPTGYMGTIAARPGFFLKTFERWRREIVLPRLIAAADLGFGAVEAAVVEIVAFTASSRVRSDRVATFWRLLNERDKESAMRDPASAEIFTTSPVEFAEIPGTPLAYWVSTELRQQFQRRPLGDLVDIQVGASSKDDFQFLRLWWEVAPSTVGRDGRWVPFAKGGGYSPYYADLHLLIDWEDDASRIAASVVAKYPYLKGNPEWVLHRGSRHFEPGLTYTRFTTSDFGPRALPAGAVFSDQGFGVFGDGEASAHLALLGYLNTRLIRYLLDLQLAAGEGTQAGTPGRKYEIGKVQVLPYLVPLRVAEDVEALVRFHQSKGLIDETSHIFIDPHARPPSTVPDRIQALDAGFRVEQAVVAELGIGKRGLEDLEKERGRHPADYPEKPDIDASEVRRLWNIQLAELANEAVRRRGGGRHLAVQSYWVDRRLELISHILEAHPASIEEVVNRLGLAENSELPRLDVSYCLGLALGRWDMRQARDAETEIRLPDPFAPLAPCSPGMLVGADGLPVKEVPSGYPIELPPDRVLHDDPGHRWDVVSIIEAISAMRFEDPDEELRATLRHVKARDLRSHMRGSFFSRHVSQYSKSRRKAPIYWYLAVPSQRWGLWVYAPWLSREQLFAVSRAAQEKLRRLLDQATQLRRDLEAGAGREVRDRLEVTEDLIRELEVFHEKAGAVAQSGWEPDLDDGSILNAAPLEDLFADGKWQKDISKHRKKLEKGEYPWATVQRQYFDRLKT